jgi:hypothetical protein
VQGLGSSPFLTRNSTCRPVSFLAVRRLAGTGFRSLSGLKRRGYHVEVVKSSSNSRHSMPCQLMIRPSIRSPPGLRLIRSGPMVISQVPSFPLPRSALQWEATGITMGTAGGSNRFRPSLPETTGS